jgi:hypothetical protein
LLKCHTSNDGATAIEDVVFVVSIVARPLPGAHLRLDRECPPALSLPGPRLISKPATPSTTRSCCTTCPGIVRVYRSCG